MKNEIGITYHISIFLVFQLVFELENRWRKLDYPFPIFYYGIGESENEKIGVYNT